MKTVFGYGFILLFFLFLIGAGYYFYQNKDGYQIIFNSNGGSVVAPVRTGFSKIADRPDDPIREGYVFAGWYLGEEKFDFSTVVEENITLTAKWEEEEVPTYCVSFDSLGGGDIDSIEVKEGETLTFPTTEKEGYEFLDWYYHNKEFDSTQEVRQNMILVAKYQKIEEKKEMVTIHFDPNGGLYIEDQSVEKGELIQDEPVPVRQGYRFVGWFLDGEEFDFSLPIQDNITLVAEWIDE